ncbi:hypothetical protein [Nonomuraea rubra]|uniref:hypothetical protein n=1 Tax=Nonomuraea rubra TaxID=46180 RepID=UPI0033D0A492
MQGVTTCRWTTTSNHCASDPPSMYDFCAVDSMLYAATASGITRGGYNGPRWGLTGVTVPAAL